MARRNGTTLIVTVLHCTSLKEIISGEQLLNWGFAMDGKVRPAGELVAPLRVVTTSHPKLPDAARVGSSPASAVPLAVGGLAAIAAALAVGWLIAARSRSAGAGEERARARPGAGSRSGPGRRPW
jgi:hypothetical protein